VTLILDLDLYILMMYLHTKNDVSTSQLEPKQDTQTQLKILPHHIDRR